MNNFQLSAQRFEAPGSRERRLHRLTCVPVPAREGVSRFGFTADLTMPELRQ
ncbi:hypothetical protein Q8A64_06120 [Oxalobacteraceae bacterium R-40]|uniref:Uncharacterized protein n=1 Tax=Keguizhuia sedimenti TaxID=3064264 RepID=A0ABU1BLW3_9BURK|nr:hypothetical protein [Oxalobacteraceae bacterium R-40]